MLPDRRVLIVGDDRLARSGLVALCLKGGLVVAGEASTLEALRMAAREGPDALIWDVGDPFVLPSLPEGFAIPVLALLANPEDAGELLATGARGILFRDTSAEQLAAAVHAVCTRSLVLDDGLSSVVRRPSRASDMTEPLTDRETEVLQLLSEGLSNKAIGARLGVSEHTAKFHVNSLLGKLGVDSRTEAVVQAARRGLLIL